MHTYKHAYMDTGEKLVKTLFELARNQQDENGEKRSACLVSLGSWLLAPWLLAIYHLSPSLDKTHADGLWRQRDWEIRRHGDCLCRRQRD